MIFSSFTQTFACLLYLRNQRRKQLGIRQKKMDLERDYGLSERSRDSLFSPGRHFHEKDQRLVASVPLVKLFSLLFVFVRPMTFLCSLHVLASPEFVSQ